MANKKILVIDDDLLNTKLVKEILEKNNYEVITATDGQDGLEKTESEQPDLIILDIIMPKMDGYTFLREIRAKEIKASQKRQPIPIVVLTGSAQMSDLFQLEGIKDYIVKPFKPEVLLDKVRHNLLK